MIPDIWQLGLGLGDPSGRNSLSLRSRPRKTPLVPHSQVPDGSPGMKINVMFTVVLLRMMMTMID